MRARLGLILGFILPSVAMAEQFVLACHLVPTHPQFQPVDDNYLIDTDERTVSDLLTRQRFTASINDTTIWWQYTDKGSGITFTTTINRLTGKARVDSPTTYGVMSGDCEKVTQRKF